MPNQLDLLFLEEVNGKGMNQQFNVSTFKELILDHDSWMCNFPTIYFQTLVTVLYARITEPVNQMEAVLFVFV